MKRTPLMINLLVGAMLLAGSVQAEIDASGHDDLFKTGNTYQGWASCKACHSGWPNFANHVEDIKNSIHWDWEKTDLKGNTVGKYSVINNYCVAVQSNEPRCTSCHIGIGWTDSTFDLTNADNIDCFVCHDGSGTYEKSPTGAGAPYANLGGLPSNHPEAVPVDFDVILKSFQEPDRDNCGACHFYGGGDEGVKHGTMDSSLSMANAVESVDVHMGGNSNMTCADCHGYGAANSVEFVGSRYSQNHTDEKLCKDCHSEGLYPNAVIPAHTGILANHLDAIACQTCHVPALARGGKATKTYWDWSTANNAKKKDSQGNTVVDPYTNTPLDLVIKNGDGDIVFHGKKGTFVWGYDIIPEYTWANGGVNTVSLDTLDANPVTPDTVFQMNSFDGSVGDASSKIFPVKVFRGIQPYDAGNDVMAVPNLFPNNANDTDAFWKGNNWINALESGSQAVDRTFSGTLGYIETEMSWIGNHMVAPKEDSVQCWECHKSKDRFDHVALGLSGGIQTDDYNVTYAGYRVHYDKFNPTGFLGHPVPADDSMQIIDTGAYMGYLEVSNAPWVYSYNMGKFLYIPEEASGLFGSWTYLAK